MTGLLTDLYEFTMGAAYVAEGIAEQPATFSLYVRELPASRGYLVVAGLDSALTYLEALQFRPEDLAVLDGLGLFGQAFLECLAGLRFTGSVRAMPEGTVAFAAEPLLEVTAPLLEAQLVETFLLNQVGAETVLASKAARYRHAAQGRPVVDFGFRRAQGLDAALKVVRSVAICGLAGTSNVWGGQRYGVPLSGTMAHSYVQAHLDEVAAFRHYAKVAVSGAVLLVDTYDSRQGIERAIDVAQECRAAGIEVRGIRLDSGELAELARHARRRLDEEGLSGLQVLVSGGLNEHKIEQLLEQDRAPIDGFGVGADLAVSADAPVLDAVYKLVAIDGRPVRKLSPGKQTWPGAKQVWRTREVQDVLGLAQEAGPDGARPLLRDVMTGGHRTQTGRATVADARACFERDWSVLPVQFKHLREPARARVRISRELRHLTRMLTRDGAADIPESSRS